jgi:hypothetical protein
VNGDFSAVEGNAANAAVSVEVEQGSFKHA